MLVIDSAQFLIASLFDAVHGYSSWCCFRETTFSFDLIHARVLKTYHRVGRGNVVLVSEQCYGWYLIHAYSRMFVWHD